VLPDIDSQDCCGIRKYSQTLRLLWIVRGTVPPAAGALRLLGDAVNWHAVGFWVPISPKVLLPLVRVTTPPRTAAVVLAAKETVTVPEPVPDKGEMDVIHDEEVLACHVQFAGVATNV
jgi:hypothetical protein